MALLKVGKHVLDVTKDDIVCTNGSRWWFETKVINGWGCYDMPIKTLCKKLIRKGILYYVDKDEVNWFLRYYKFNIEKLEEYLKEESEKKKSKEK